MPNHWASVKQTAGDISVDQEAQLLLHEVLHVLYSSAVDEQDGQVNRDQVAQLLVDKFRQHSH